MNILKIGKNHIETGMNCQDAIGRYGEELKVVCDGCSEGKHSEIGAQLFAKRFVEKYKYFREREKNAVIFGNFGVDDSYKIGTLIQSTMDDIVNFVGDDKDSILDYLSFTTIIAHGNKRVISVGDGYVIEIDRARSKVRFVKLDCGDYPEYLSYNYLNPDLLKKYKYGVELSRRIFNPTIENIDHELGVASDGIRFVADLPKDNPLRQEFVDIILSDRDIRMKRFINKHPEIFKDDVSIVI